jgi:hypothetical protein
MCIIRYFAVGLAAAIIAAGCTTPTSPKVPDPTIANTPSTGVRITGLPGTVLVGESVQLTATVTLPDGAEKQVADPAWQSSDVQVATVSPTGLMTVVGNGTTNVSVSAYGHSASASLRAVSRIIGVVHENAPTEDFMIPAATVAIRGGTDHGMTTTTDANGQFMLQTIDKGGFEIIVTKAGYDPFTYEIAQLPRQRLTFAMAPTEIVHRWRMALPDFEGLGGHWGSDEVEIEVLRGDRPANMTLFGTCRTEGTYEKFSAYVWKIGAERNSKTAFLQAHIGRGPQTVEGTLPKGRYSLKISWRALFDQCELAINLRHF